MGNDMLVYFFFSFVYLEFYPFIYYQKSSFLRHETSECISIHLFRTDPAGPARIRFFSKRG